jgi:electron transfer flavoprotein alpha subunit
MSNQILVVVEHLKGNIEDISFEMLGKGKEIAGNTGGELVALLMGSGVEGMTAQLGIADKIIYVDDANLAEYNPQAYCKTVTEVVAANQPKMLMIGNTSMGMDIAGGVSVDLKMPFIAYVSDISTDGNTVTSSLYGGKMNVDSSAGGDGCVLAVIAGSFPADDGKKEGNSAVETVAAPDFSDLTIQFKQLIEPEGGDVDITAQDVLVSVGRGIQSDENLPMAEELAGKLGGAVSCSRPIVDSKWLSKTRQVGKSGLKVQPKCYLALGISGAPEHIEGMKDADLIIAINTDPDAPIFDYAHYGVVQDLFDIIPALNDKL